MRLRKSLKDILNTATQGAILRDGIHVAIAGKPNAGKSSLLNMLTKQSSAIVTRYCWHYKRCSQGDDSC